MTEILSTLKILPETKDEIKRFGESLINSIAWGDISPLELDGRLKAIEMLIEMVRKSPEMKDLILNEAYKYGGKEFEIGNFKFCVKEVGTKYNYSGCNDCELFDLEKQKAEIDAKIKSRHELLKTIKPDTEIYGSDGVKLAPPSKESTTSVITMLR